ncbi:hypothetical protein TDB9533_02052 [Thalassocella blandensis]|nr:hypothetical protein TDB9533_02052 [Thalassocella blandensis]
MRIKLFTAALLLMSTNFVLSAEELVEKTNISTGNMALGKTLLGLVVVTSVIYGLAWCVKKFTHGNFMQQNGMRIISAMPLGTREKAVLLEVENKKILLGVSPGGISQLYVFNDEVSQAADGVKANTENVSSLVNVVSVTESSSNNPIKQDFSSYLKDVLNFSAGRKV